MIDYQQIVVDGVLTGLGRLWWLVAIAGLVALARTPVVKGWIGEALVRVSARIALKPSIHRAFYDVTLARDGGTTRLDHILVSPYGVIKRGERAGERFRVCSIFPKCRGALRYNAVT